MFSVRLATLRAFAALALIAACCDARAQSQQPEDPRIGIYRQLLADANDRLASAAALYNTLSAKNAQTEAELAKLRAEKPKD